MKNLVKILGLFSILVGCAATEHATPAADNEVVGVVAPSPAVEMTTVVAEVEDPTECKARFYVAESDDATDEDLVALQVELEWVTARWSKATGCDVAVGAEGEGIAVSIIDSIHDEKGEEKQGVWQPGTRTIKVVADRWFAILAHEVGHALSQRHGHVDHGNDEGPQSYLMEPGCGQGVITLVDLEWVCEKFNCQVMDPEEVVYQD